MKRLMITVILIILSANVSLQAQMRSEHQSTALQALFMVGLLHGIQVVPVMIWIDEELLSL